MGVVPQAPTVYEVLEELAITVQNQMIDTRLPFCAFNGASALHRSFFVRGSDHRTRSLTRSCPCAPSMVRLLCP